MSDSALNCLSERKLCPLCREPVHPEARKCPHCQHFLNKWILVAYHPLTAGLFLILVYLGAGFFVLRMFDPGENFETHRAKICVTQSEMQFGELKTGPTVAIIGTIHNGSKVAWKSLALDVRFFNKSHKLIDSVQTHAYYDRISANEDGTFKVSQKREFDLAEYATHEVRVIGARDAHCVFP